MVQVDVFWSYALGASFATAACRQLSKEDKPFANKFFSSTVLFLACLFAPSGVYLLWQFPHWETMQVATCRDDLPAWLVTAFAVTNITQGVLGFWISYHFIRQKRFFAASMQIFLGYFFMVFILLYGWDGTGWQRFLYDATVNGGILWKPGMHMGLGFLKSNVALTLLGMGVAIVPALYLPMIAWIRTGLYHDPDITADEVPSPLKLAIIITAVCFGLNIALAAGAAVVCAIAGRIIGNVGIGILIGIPVSLIAYRFLLFAPGRPGYKAYSLLFVKEPK
ncbi:MAG: hypothetical protein AB1921_09865 [Thermodesulfobacteriota bacterium]